jgi:hypothetical protein
MALAQNRHKDQGNRKEEDLEMNTHSNSHLIPNNGAKSTGGKTAFLENTA